MKMYLKFLAVILMAIPFASTGKYRAFVMGAKFFKSLGKIRNENKHNVGHQCTF